MHTDTQAWHWRCQKIVSGHYTQLYITLHREALNDAYMACSLKSHSCPTTHGAHRKEYTCLGAHAQVCPSIASSSHPSPRWRLILETSLPARQEASRYHRLGKLHCLAHLSERGRRRPRVMMQQNAARCTRSSRVKVHGGAGRREEQKWDKAIVVRKAAHSPTSENRHAETRARP